MIPLRHCTLCVLLCLALLLSVSHADTLAGEIVLFHPPQPEELEAVALEAVDGVALSEGWDDAANMEEDLSDMNTGIAGSTRPYVPEPMVFDLIRPLGARKGELEINTLSVLPLRGKRSRLNWAPEIEYAFRDGYAIEFELPMENLAVESYKLALQGTVGTVLDNRLIHGWQVLGEYGRHDRSLRTDAMYIVGHRINDRWSLLSMSGLRHTDITGGGRFRGLLNNSLFYAVSDKLTFGLETNLELARRTARNSYLIMPQIHLEIGRHYSLQLGGGFERYSHGRLRPVLGMRLIREI